MKPAQIDSWYMPVRTPPEKQIKKQNSITRNVLTKPLKKGPTAPVKVKEFSAK